MGLAASAAGPLPGGYAAGDPVFYTGDSQTVSTGDKLTLGQAGEVTGHPASDDSAFGKGVSVMFPGNKENISCYLTKLSRTPP